MSSTILLKAQENAKPMGSKKQNSLVELRKTKKFLHSKGDIKGEWGPGGQAMGGVGGCSCEPTSDQQRKTVPISSKNLCYVNSSPNHLSLEQTFLQKA